MSTHAAQSGTNQNKRTQDQLDDQILRVAYDIFGMRDIDVFTMLKTGSITYVGNGNSAANRTRVYAALDRAATAGYVTEGTHGYRFAGQPYAEQEAL